MKSKLAVALRPMECVIEVLKGCPHVSGFPSEMSHLFKKMDPISNIGWEILHKGLEELIDVLGDWTGYAVHGCNYGLTGWVVCAFMNFGYVIKIWR